MSFVSYDVTPVTVLELPLSDFLPLLVFTGQLHHSSSSPSLSPRVGLSAYCTCRWTDRLFLLLIGLFMDFFFLFDRIPLQRMPPHPHTLRPCGHKRNSLGAGVFPQMATQSLRNQGPVSVCVPVCESMYTHLCVA